VNVHGDQVLAWLKRRLGHLLSFVDKKKVRILPGGEGAGNRLGKAGSEEGEQDQEDRAAGHWINITMGKAYPGYGMDVSSAVPILNKSDVK